MRTRSESESVVDTGSDAFSVSNMGDGTTIRAHAGGAGEAGFFSIGDVTSSAAVLHAYTPGTGPALHAHADAAQSCECAPTPSPSASRWVPSGVTTAVCRFMLRNKPPSRSQLNCHPPPVRMRRGTQRLVIGVRDEISEERSIVGRYVQVGSG